MLEVLHAAFHQLMSIHKMLTVKFSKISLVLLLKLTKIQMNATSMISTSLPEMVKNMLVFVEGPKICQVKNMNHVEKEDTIIL